MRACRIKIQAKRCKETTPRGWRRSPRGGLGTILVSAGHGSQINRSWGSRLTSLKTAAKACSAGRWWAESLAAGRSTRRTEWPAAAGSAWESVSERPGQAGRRLWRLRGFLPATSWSEQKSCSMLTFETVTFDVWIDLIVQAGDDAHTGRPEAQAVAARGPGLG